MSEVYNSSDIVRMDSEFFKKVFLEASILIAQKKHQKFSQIVTKIQHPTEVLRVYEDSGLQILLAQNVRDNYFDFSNEVFMRDSLREVLQNNLVN